MELSCIGYYFIKTSSSFKLSENKNDWINADIKINAEIDRYTLEIKHIGEEDDVYDEDEDDKGLKMIRKIRICDFRICESRGHQRYNDRVIYVIVLIPKRFSKSKKIFLAFINEETQLIWLKNFETIFNFKVKKHRSSLSMPDLVSTLSLDSFMIENDVYEGSLLPGQFIVNVIENEKSRDLQIKGQYVLMITENGLQLWNEGLYEVLKVWDIKNIKKFGEKENIFFMELGNHDDEGPGVLSFKITKAKEFWEQLIACKNNYLKNKMVSSAKIKPEKLATISEDSKEEKINPNHDSILGSIPPIKYSLKDENVSGPNTSPIKEKRNSSIGPPKIPPPPVPVEILSIP